MKKLIIIFLLLSKIIVSQNEYSKLEYNEIFFNLTDNQKAVVKFIDDNLDKKVGNGICVTLCNAIENSFNSIYKHKDSINVEMPDEVKREFEVGNKKHLKTGDFIAIIGDDKIKIRHVVIIYGISNKKIYIAEQNCDESLDKSVVRISILDEKRYKKIYGKVKYIYYRSQIINP